MTDTLLIPLRRVYQIPADKETETEALDYYHHVYFQCCYIYRD